MSDTEDRLRHALRAAADTVVPAGDGLMKIQQRVRERRARAWWTRPVVGVAAAAVLAAAGVGAWALTSGDGSPGDHDTVIGNQVRGETPSPTPSATETSAAPAPSAQMFWPHGTSSYTQAKDAAVAFAKDYLRMPEVAQIEGASGSGDTATVDLGRQLPSESKQNVTVMSVHLQKANGAWYVQAVSANALGIDGVQAGNPAIVSGKGTGVDEVLRVEVRDGTGTVIGSTHQSFGGDNTGWSARVTYSGTPDSVVAWTDSALDGAPARVVATSWSAWTGGSAQPATYPENFVGVRDGRIALFSSRNGAGLRYLTDKQPGGGDSDPFRVGAQTYFLRGGGTCSNGLWTVVDGQGPATQVYAPQGSTISSYAVTADKQTLALVLASCSDSSWRLVTRDVRTGSTTTVESNQAKPPLIVGNPSWSPDGKLAYVLRTGNQAGVQVWDSSTKTSTSWCGDESQRGLPMAVAFGGQTLYAGFEEGGSIAIRSCTTSATTKLFDVAGASLDSLAASSGGALLAESGTDLYIYADGQTHRLTTAEPHPTGVAW